MLNSLGDIYLYWYITIYTKYDNIIFTGKTNNSTYYNIRLSTTLLFYKCFTLLQKVI